MTMPALVESTSSKGKANVDILLVDDEVRNLEALESILTSPDYRLIRAQSAQEALMALIDGDFAAIVLDIQMPGTSGIELAHLIKQRKRTQHIPIIFLTAYFHEDKDVLQGYEVGAVEYLTKPLAPQILKSKIAVFVELFQKNRELAALNAALEVEIAQRRKAEQELWQANNELESRVQERTEQLMQANDELRMRNTAVQESEQRYSQLISSLPAAVYTTDAEGRVTLYNEAAVTLWGRKPEVGKDLWCGSYKIFNPDGTDLPLDQCPMAITLKEGRPVRGQEIIVERPDGIRRNVLPYPDPIRDVSGKIIGAVNMLLDITESKRAEAASRQLAAIVESSDDAIISKNLNSIIISWNQGAAKLFGYKADEVIGKPITILMPPERWNEEPAILQRIRRGQHIEHYETVRQRKDGTLIEISLTISPIRDADGKVIGASKIARDITRQKQAERELESIHKEVLEASRAKDDFLAALSHELRTPLSPVLLVASEAAEDPQLPDEVRAQFTTIRHNVELEARLIDDLLDLTRITHGKLSLNKDPVDVHTLLKEAITTVRSELDQKQITLTLELAAKKPVVNGDAVRLQQVFWNVLKNAAKFTPEAGKISVGTRIQAETGELIITITDNGFGITSDEIGRIFEAFSQGEHARPGGAHRFGGLGLGLAISRRLVESHSGSIQASSKGRNQGSTFTITLPSVDMEPSPETVPVSASSNGNAGTIHILLVEDHEPTRTALAHLLTRRRYKVQTAASVAEARALSEKHAFHLLISDIGLPDGNGFELMKELRHSNPALQGIALTGYGMEEDIARSQRSGFSSHLVKPVRVQFLEAVLAEVVSRDAVPDA
jgi:PAS domain S-box-containing protein